MPNFTPNGAISSDSGTASTTRSLLDDKAPRTRSRRAAHATARTTGQVRPRSSLAPPLRPPVPPRPPSLPPPRHAALLSSFENFVRPPRRPISSLFFPFGKRDYSLLRSYTLALQLAPHDPQRRTPHPTAPSVPASLLRLLHRLPVPSISTAPQLSTALHSSRQLDSSPNHFDAIRSQLRDDAQA